MNKQQLSRFFQIIANISTVILVAIIFVIIFLLVHPFERGFHCNDDTIRYPYKPDTIPLWVAGLYGVLGALFIVFMTELYLNRPCCTSEQSYDRKRKICHGSIVHAILIYTMGAMATLLITEIGKHTIGRPRPYFLTVCKPKWDLIKCFDTIQDSTGSNIQIANYIPFSYDLCSNDDRRVLKEARLSFPSGHSSFTVYSMMFIIIYLEARIKSQRTRFIKASIQLIAFIASWHTCMSRVSDHKHHYSDVIAGASIGFSVALFSTLVMGKILWIYGLDDEQPVDQENKFPKPEIISRAQIEETI